MSAQAVLSRLAHDGGAVSRFDVGGADAGRGAYAAAAEDYWRAGFRGVIPIPAKAKTPPPKGYTGEGLDPSYPDLMAWCEGREGDGNIAIRLPVDVVGIDVDDYGDKVGEATLAALEGDLGPLPATWRTTSRDDGTSGIRLYRAPAGLRWQNPGDSIEVIHHGWRYAVVWPSVHPEGRTYRWINPAGDVATDLPTSADLPHLPAAWVERLNAGSAEHVHRNRLDHKEARTWLASLGNTSESMCRRMGEAASADAANLARVGASAHDTTCAAVARLVRLGAERHSGAEAALEQVRQAFLANVTRPGRTGQRSDVEAQTEWLAILISAINLVSADGPTLSSCDCDGRLTAGIVAAAQRPLCGDVDPSTVDTGAVVVGPSDDGDHLHASWEPIDLTPYLDGTHEPDVPTLLTRTDGVSLLYPGLVHSIHGESESGKSMVMQAEVVCRVAAGEPVLYVDFESDPGSVLRRLRTLGATADQLCSHLTYVNPEVDPRTITELPYWNALLSRPYVLAVLDGVTDGLTVFGYESNSNDDIARFMRVLPKTIAARTGAAVVLIDHVTKSVDGRGRFAIGGQAKVASLTGAAYTVEVPEPIAPGRRGVIVLRVGKDRPGGVRSKSGRSRASDRTQEAARVVVDSTGVPTRVTVEPWRGADGTEPVEPFRPTTLMEKLSRALEDSPEPRSFRMLDELVPGKQDNKRVALERLVLEGYVSRKPGPRRSLLHQHLQPYRQAADARSDGYAGAGYSRPDFEPVTLSDPYNGDRDTDTQPYPETLGMRSGDGRGDAA